MPATTLLDCISQVTNSPEKFRGLPHGLHATQTFDHAPENVFLSTFGRSQRTSPCACETRSEPTLSQALHLLHGSTIRDKIENGGVVKDLLAGGQSPAAVIDHLYLRCLSRHPEEAELQELISLVQASASPAEGLHDVFWALLNSSEFVFIH
jgi:hypothetical protein